MDNLYEERKSKVLGFIRDEEYKPMRQKDIAAFLMIKAEDMQMFYDIMTDLESEGKIMTTKKGRVILPESQHIYTGVFSGNARGFGFVKAEGLEKEIFISAHCVNGAMNKDTVMCRIIDRSAGGKAEGEVIKVVKRGMRHIVGVYQQVKSFGFVIPDDKKIADDIFIAEGDNGGAVNGHKVVVDITKYAVDGRRNPEGRVIEVLGHIDDPGVDILSIIRRYDLPVEFPEKVMKSIENIPSALDPDEEKEQFQKGIREDLRNVMMVTIDGEDAKDLDDAVSVEKTENGNYRLGVYIADVSHYVKEGSLLDKEAYKRGTSVYLVDRVIPMLPHKLSNGICSLNEGEDRNTLCCVMEIDGKGAVVNSEIKKAVVNINRRMSYTVVNDILTNENSQYKEEYGELVPMFKLMEELRNIMLDKRKKRGAIEFDFAEAKIIVNEKGKPVDIVKRERNVATSIIEEFMLAANETIAEHFFWLDIPFVYRTHEEPDEEKIESLRTFLWKFGYTLKGKSNHPKCFQQLLEQVKGKQEEMLVHRMTLRSLKQARYTAENGRHFGLAAKYYCHFTSPIRRYPDLQIHRIISESIDGTLTEDKIRKYSKILPAVANLCSVNERRAEEAERDTDKYKIAQYMQERIGQEFDGIISGVTSWGIYVELENTVEGMVSVKNMDDDYYIFKEEDMCYFGERTHKTYTVGDKVRVLVADASPGAGTIDFEFVGDKKVKAK